MPSQPEILCRLPNIPQIYIHPGSVIPRSWKLQDLFLFLICPENASELNGEELERAKLVFSIYDFEGNETLDGFHLGSALRALGLTPTIKSIEEKFGGQKRKGLETFSVEQFLSIYSAAKKDKDVGNVNDYLEILKLYDKSGEGLMSYEELKHILLAMGEKLEAEEVTEILKDCAVPPDEDGFTSYGEFLNKLMAGPNLKVEN